MLMIFSAHTSLANDTPDILLEKGKLSLYKNNYQNAISFFNKAIDLEATSYESYYYRGLTYLYLNEFEKSIEDFTNSIKYKPDYPDSYNNRGLAYSYMEQYPEALADFDKAIELDPKFSEAFMNRGSFYLYAENFINARKDFEMAEKLKSTNPELYFLRGRLNYTESKFKDAIQDFSKAIKLGMNNQKIYYNRANAYVRNNEHKKAVADYTKALEFDPEDLPSLNNRAYCYDQLGNSELAEKDKLRHHEILDKLYPKPTFGEMKKTSDPDNNFSFDLPENWHIWFNKDSDNTNLLISKDSINPYSDPLIIGAIGGLITKFPDELPNISAESLIQYWEASRVTIAQNFALYEYKQKKSMKLNGFDTFENLTRAKYKEDDVTFVMLEFAIITDGKIFFLNLQAPENIYYQYDEVFQKIKKSVIVNFKNEDK